MTDLQQKYKDLRQYIWIYLISDFHFSVKWQISNGLSTSS